MYNYNKSVFSPYDPTKLAIHSNLRPEDDRISNCGPNVKKTVCFVDIVRFIDEENMVSYVDFDCGITLFPKTLIKIKQINQERKYISRSHKKLQYIPSTDQHTSSVDEQHSSNISLNPYRWWDMSPAALMSLNHTNHIYSMFNQYHRLTTQQPRTDSYPVFSSLRTMDSKTKGLRVSFAFFQWNYLPEGMNETVAKVEELSDLWKPVAVNGTPPLVMNCNCI